MKQIETHLGKLVYREVDDPIPTPGEALIEIKSIGLCYSDVAPYKGRFLDLIPLPFVMGHEFGGIIKELNGESSKFSLGDKVGVYPHKNCGTCYYCIHNLEHMCDDQSMFGSPQKEGAFSELISVPIENLVKLGDSFDIKYAGLIEPASIAYHTVARFKDSTVAVMGVGAIGAMMGIILKQNNCRFIALDIDERALDFAKGLGAELTINLKDKNKMDKIKSYLADSMIDVVVIAYLSQENLDFALDIVRKEGTIIEMSTPKELRLDFNKLFFKAINLKGSICCSSEEFKKVAKLIEEGIIPAEKIVTRTFPFEKASEAFEYKANEFSLKVIVVN